MIIFILDYRISEVKGLVERCLAYAPGLGKDTAIAVGSDVQLYTSELIDYDTGNKDIGIWINEWIGKLGDNIVIIEGDKGLFEDKKDYDILYNNIEDWRNYNE